MTTLKKFIRYYRPYRWLFAADMLCAFTVCIIDLAFPQILRFLTAETFQKPAQEIIRLLGWIGAGLLVMYLIRYGCQYFITNQGHVMGAKMERDMRRDLFDHFQRLPFSYYDRNNTGEMMSRLVADLFDITELAHHGPENLVISVLKVCGAFLLLMFINVKMTLILLAVTLLMAAFSLAQNRKMRAVFLDNRKKIATVNSLIQDSLAGIRVVKSFANEELEREKFGSGNDRFLDSKISSYKVMGFFHAGNNLFQGLLYTVILTSGGYFIAQGTLEAAELAIYALYIGIFLNPIEVLINFTEQFQKGFAGFRRFTEIIETVPEITDAPDAAELNDVTGAVRYEHVSFRYAEHSPVLEDVTLSIAPGKTVALVGPSGGGKTTFCSLLPRFYDVTGGRIEIDGHDVRSVTQKSLRNVIGIVQQEAYLFSGTLRENIAYGKPGATEPEIIEAAKRANIHDFIMGLADGYDSYAGERGTRLSGGQKQRIAIARIFLKNPPILILDEATSALDNESERHIQTALEELSRGRTTIVIAHRLSTIRQADEIIVIDDHGIKERGTHSGLLETNGLYAKYYRMQFDGADPLIG